MAILTGIYCYFIWWKCLRTTKREKKEDEYDVPGTRSIYSLWFVNSFDEWCATMRSYERTNAEVKKWSMIWSDCDNGFSRVNYRTVKNRYHFSSFEMIKKLNQAKSILLDREFDDRFSANDIEGKKYSIIFNWFVNHFYHWPIKTKPKSMKI